MLSHSLIRLFLTVLILGLLFLFVQMRSQPVPARGLDVADNAFSAQRAFALLSQLLAEEVPHPIGSIANHRLRQRIEEHLTAIGYEVEIQRAGNCTSRACATVENIIGVPPGASDAPAVLLAAHYDSVSTSPGVADDGAGVVAVLEAARILGNEGPFRNPIYVLLTDGEELDRNGAHAFVQEHPLAQNVGVVINLEARGTSGASTMFETSEGNGWLIGQFTQVAPRPTSSSLFFEVYKLLPNDTDLTVFKEAGMSGYGFAFADDVENYHQPTDNLDNLSLDSLQHHGENALNLARHLANADLTQAKSDNLIYHDILSLFVVRYPVWLGNLLAVLLLVAFFALAIVWRKREQISLVGIAVGMGTTIAVFLLPLLLFLIPEEMWAGVPIARPLIILVVIVIAYGTVSMRPSMRPGRERLLDLSMAVWIPWALIALLLSLLVPGASVIFFLPVFCAALLHLLLLWKPQMAQAVFFASLICTAIIWLKLAILFDIALSIEVGPAIIALPLAVLTTTALPWLNSDKKSAR